MADEQPNGTDTQDDEELLCMVLSRIEPIAERVRAIQELACTVLDAKADQLEKDRYARLMIQQCTGLLDYLGPLQQAAIIQAWYAARSQELFLDAKQLH